MAKAKKKNIKNKPQKTQTDKKEEKEFINVEKLTDKEEEFAVFRKTGFNSFTSVISVLLGGLCVPIVLAFIALFIISAIGISQQQIYDSPLIYCLYSCSAVLGYGVYVFILIKWKNKKNTEYYGENKIKQTQFIQAKKCNYKMVLLSVFIAVMSLVLLNAFVTMTTQGLQGLGYSKSNNLPFKVDCAGNYILYLVFFCALPAICEEFLFRGVILGGLLNTCKNHIHGVVAVMISALIFALCHQSAQQFVYPLIMGMVFGFLYYYTGNIWYSVIAHFASNALVVTVDFILELTHANIQIATYTWQYCLVACLLAGIFAVLIYIILKMVRKKYARESVFDVEANDIRVNLVYDNIKESREELKYITNDGIIRYRASMQEKQKTALIAGICTLVLLFGILIYDLTLYL